jgi:predicted alpha/beta hydrolase
MTAAFPRLVPPVPSTADISFGSGPARLAGRLYLPGPMPRAAIVLHGATGVPQGFYRGFAEWLAGQGYACLTYDYQDFGASAGGGARRSPATMADWGLSDQPAAQTELERQVPGTPVWAVGHSFGGLMLPFHPGAGRLSRVIAVASGLVHLGDHPWPYRAAAAAFWYGPGPLATGLAGYLPGRMFGMGADIPAGVYWQWRRWCTTRGFYLTDIGRTLPVPDWQAVTAPAKFVAVADDDMVPPAAVWRAMTLYPEARKRQQVLRPVSAAAARIGHMGAFRRENAALWPEILA